MRALILLARSDGERVTCEQLAQEQGIPTRFLEAILAELRRAGIVASQRGIAGGYRLARSPAQVAVADVIRALDGPLAEVRGMRPEHSEYLGPVQPLQEVWVAARASLRGVLEHVTVADIASGKLPRHISKLTKAPEAWVSR